MVRKAKRFFAAFISICISIAACSTGMAAERELAMDESLDMNKYNHISELPEIIAGIWDFDAATVEKELLDEPFEKEVLSEYKIIYTSGQEPNEKYINLSMSGKTEGDNPINRLYYSDESKNDADICVDEVFTIEPVFQLPETQQRFAPRDLDFMPMEQAQRMVEEKLTALGVPNFALEKAYSLSREDIIAELKGLEQWGYNPNEYTYEELYNMAESVYAFHYAQSFCGVLMSSYHHSTTYDITQTEYLSEGAIIEVYVCADGIFGIGTSSLKEPLSTGEPKPIVTAQKALEAAVGYYSGRRATIGKVLKSCDLLYYFDDIGDDKCRLHPVWVFYVEKKGDRYYEFDGMPDKEYCVVDAYTGEVARVV